MTGSAIYRYYSSRDDLLAALVVDGFTSLAEDLEAAERALPPDLAAPERWLRVARAYRKWALGHRREYAVLFGHAGGEAKPGDEGRRQAHRRGVSVLFRVMATCVLGGHIDLAGIELTLSPALRRQLEAWRQEEGIDLPVAALAGCMTAWSHLHGMLSLELFGGFPRQVRPVDELFDQQMRSLFLGPAGGHHGTALPAIT